MKLHSIFFLYFINYVFISHSVFNISLTLVSPHQISSVSLDPLFRVHRHALFICKFTSPCSIVCLFVFLKVLIWFPSVVFERLSESSKWGWLTRWSPATWMFWYSHQRTLNPDLRFCSFSSCCVIVVSWFESQKCMNKPLPLVRHQYYVCIYFSRKVHKTWASTHIKQNRTICETSAHTRQAHAPQHAREGAIHRHRPWEQHTYKQFNELEQWFLTWGKFTPGGKFHVPRG